MNEYRFEREAEVVHDSEELRELLARLQGEEAELPRRTDKVTIHDVAEALGMSSQSVAEVLDQIHAEHHEARVASVLRELEEPLYRVERASPVNADPLGPGNPLFRLKSVQTLAAMSRKKVELEPVEEVPEPLGPKVVSYLILFGMVGSLVVIVIRAMWQIFAQRV